MHESSGKAALHECDVHAILAQAAGVALSRLWAQNGAVPKSLRLPMLAALLAALCLPAVLQSHVMARTVAKSAPVDINTASLDELLKVPGMTRVWAAGIVRYRPYRTKLELEDHGIVSEEVYERIKNHVIAHHDEK